MEKDLALQWADGGHVVDFLPAERMTRYCVTCRATLRETLAAIDAGGNEVAFVLDNEATLVGVVTDGDVRRALLAGRSLDEARAEEIMSRQFRSVSEESGNHRAAALDLMHAYGIQQVPVVSRLGRLVGLHVIEEFIDQQPLPNWAVILAGGRGTRLRPITETIPKPMVKVAGRPILERLVWALVSNGIRRIYLAVNYKKEVIESHFGDGTKHGCAIRYLQEDTPLGTGGPLRLLPGRPPHPILVMNGDLVGDFPIRRMLDFHEQGGYSMTVGVGLHSYEVPFGVVRRSGDTAREIEEKPTESWWVNYGIYVVDPDLIARIPRGVEFPITELVGQTLASGGNVGAFELSGDWQDVGRPEDLRAANGYSTNG